MVINTHTHTHTYTHTHIHTHTHTHTRTDKYFFWFKLDIKKISTIDPPLYFRNKRAFLHTHTYKTKWPFTYQKYTRIICSYIWSMVI
jgi:hypothetical protein